MTRFRWSLAVQPRIPGWLVRKAVERPVVVKVLWSAAVVLALCALPWLRVETSTGSILDKRSPEWLAYQAAQELFGGDEIVVVALEDAEPFSEDVVRAIARLSSALEETPGVRRVDSVSTVPLVREDESGALVLEPLLREGMVPSGMSSDELLRLYRQDRLAPGNLVSNDGRVLAANVLLERNADEHYAQIFDAIREEAGPAAKVSGVPVFRFLANEETRHQLGFFGPMTVVMVAVAAVVLFRSVSAAVAALLPGGLATILVLGVMAAVGLPVTISTVILPPVLLAVGCAYAVHIYTAMHAESIQTIAQDVAPGVALSSLTTAIGFLGVALVDIEAIRQLGAMGSLGALLAGGAALTAVPVVSRERSAARIPRWEVPSVPTLAVVAGVVLAAGVGLFGIPRLRVETDVIRWFPRSHEARAEYEWVRSRLSGISPVNLIVEAKAGAVTDSQILASMQALSRKLEGRTDVGRVLSVADPLVQLHSVAQPGGQLGEIPNEELVEQYLLLLESSEHLRDYITADREHANILLRVDDNTSRVLVNVARDAERWWKKSGPDGSTLTATGIMYEFARAEDAIADGQIRALTFAGVIVGVILLLVTRSPIVSAIALVANVLPLVAVFGLMGVVGVPVDAGTVLVGNLALGIGVDDSIHVVWAYQRRAQRGASAATAARGAVADVGMPVLATTCVLCVGFAVLGLSELAFTKELGLLTVAVLGFCLLADLWLLPELLARAPRGAKATRRKGRILS